MAYDLNGNLISRTDTRGTVTTWDYDILNRETVKTVTPQGGLPVHTLSRYDERGVSNTGRLTTLALSDNATTIPAGQPRIEYLYGSLGNLADLSYFVTEDGISRRYSTRYTYQQEALLDSVTYVVNDVVSGSVQQPALLDETFTGFTYDYAGRLISAPGLLNSTTFDPQGNVAQVSYPNGVLENYGYDAARGWLDTLGVLFSRPGAEIRRPA